HHHRGSADGDDFGRVLFTDELDEHDGHDDQHQMVVDRGGSFSAEHGVGRLKVGDLERWGDPARLKAMRAIKATLAICISSGPSASPGRLGPAWKVVYCVISPPVAAAERQPPGLAGWYAPQQM
ncbi:FAD-linked oxidase C-terminal domain-containing protein, partial [Paracoccus sp. APAP_BH8]|uniref:FAD-linked oxidase C-terminal domain-containing protein n=1 Tax=Paracoccus sp. APAP_BH8 TaxID=3110237 RepID=UPI003FA6D8AB